MGVFGIDRWLQVVVIAGLDTQTCVKTVSAVIYLRSNRNRVFTRLLKDVEKGRHAFKLTAEEECPAEKCS